MSKNKSTLSAVVRIVVLIAVMVACVGIVVNIVGDVNDTVDSFGGGSTKKTTETTGTTIPPTDCKNHEYDTAGICIKCGTVCTHADSKVSSNGNTYCTICGKLQALKAPVLSVSGNVVSWAAVADAISYNVYVDGTKYQTTSTKYNLLSSKAGEYVVSVQAVNGSVLSEKSENVLLKYYEVTYNVYDHGMIETGSYIVPHGDSFEATILPKSGHQIPSEVYITMGGVELGSSAFSYDSTTGDLVINNVTGDIYITYDAPSELPATPTLSISGSVVSWNAVSGATSYKIRVTEWDGYTYDQYFEITETRFDLADLNLAENEYTVAVWAVNSYGEGEAVSVTYNPFLSENMLQLPAPVIELV